MVNIIIVDRDQKCLDRLCNIFLEIDGCSICRKYTNAFSALDAAKENPPDILITDILVLGMSGIGLALQIKKLYPKIPIVLMTDRPSLTMEVYDIGVEGIITKPLSEEAVVKTIRRIRENA